MVTGAGKGIGRHIVRRLAAVGYRVAVTGRDVKALREVADELHIEGHIAQAIRCDVSVPEEVSSAVEYVEASWGRIDVAVCNAGIAGPVGVCEDIALDEWQQALLTNLTGAFLVCRAVLPVMKRAGTGAIILVGSTTGKRAVETRTAYATSKMGLIGFGRSLAAEVGPFGVSVNTVCPGVVLGSRWTKVVAAFAASEGVSEKDIESRYKRQTFLRRFVEPEHVAELVTYLASPAGRTITGQDLNICAGLLTS